jgi:glycosyltransferase involved in cell wall biosynthesis
MRILHLDSGREMRGGQWQVLRLHRGLLKGGHESLLLARDQAPLLLAARQENLPCQALSILALRRHAKRFDLLHAHDARTHTLAAIHSSLPFVVSRRVAFPLKKTFLTRWKYARARRFLAVSRFVADQLTHAGIDHTLIDVVYDGVPVPPTASNGTAILTPHSSDPGKCMSLAFAAAAEAGLPLIATHNLELDLPNARALLYLSQSEGLGSGILLAMAAGVTVIASSTGGIPELIQDGVTGILTENTTAAIAAALRRLDPRFGAAARLEVMQRFTVEHMVSATIKSYERV